MDCWGDCKDDPTSLNAPCVWTQYWVELASPAKVADYRQYLENYSDQQRSAGRFERPNNIRLRNVMQWLDFNHVVPEDVRLQAWLAFGFLLVCLVNTVGLLLAKFLRRSGEIGVRRALGAPQRRHLRPGAGRSRHGGSGRRPDRPRPRAARAVGSAQHPATISADSSTSTWRCWAPRSRSRSRPACWLACCPPGAPARSRRPCSSRPSNHPEHIMEIRPILSTLGRHKTAAALIVLEIAVSCRHRLQRAVHDRQPAGTHAARQRTWPKTRSCTCRSPASARTTTPRRAPARISPRCAACPA